LSSAELVSPVPHILNGEQQKALDDINLDIESGEFKTRLLYGVTGSGKTEVYMRAMKSVLENGGSCVFLVPEIALTPQTVGRLRSRLGDCGLVVWHSNLTDGQRLDAWRALARGEARVVVGARSCVFAPVKNLRLIIVDEEHDTAYKQDKNPRYNGRDIAVLRAKLCGCACVLGSATPALETLYNAKNGKYLLSEIRNRIDGRKLPSVFIADMKREKPGTVLSRILCEKIAQRLDNMEQTILFLNRRGYSKIFECPDCGNVEECPHCSISLTWHRREDIVKCHLCGYTAKAPSRCRKCGSEKARWRGHGTQKVEDIVAQMFPSARVGRMDRDAMNRRDNYRRVLGDFRAGKLDILIGTQMIAKGLDFPRVTLVGIIDADISLHMPDFRAAEKTYQLIVQVAGRAGRGDGNGEVVIQTLKPESAPIQYAKRDDMNSFLEEELRNRTEFSYPPAMRLIRQIFRSRSEQKLAFYTEQFARAAEKELEGICQIRGPSPAPLEKSEDFYRWHIWYFCPSVKPVVAAILGLKKKFPMDEDIDDVLDVDPMSLM
jgi:primosomal protein N'